MLNLLLLLATALPLSDKLREVNKADTELKTDLAERDLDEVFSLIETTRTATNELFARLDLAKKSTQSLRIRLFAHAADYEDLRRRTFNQRTDVHSMSFYDDQDRTIGAAWEGGTDRARGELRGQIARQMMDNYSKTAPPWLREAIFCYLEGLTTDPYGDPIDFLNHERLDQIRHAVERNEYCPLYELMDLREPQFYGIAGAVNNSKYPRETLYSESWAIFYFLSGSPEPQDKALFKAVGERLETGRWSQSQFEKALAELEPRWKQFLSGDAGGRAGQLRAEAWQALGKNDPRRARDLAAEAVTLDKSSASAQRALGHASLAVGDPVAAMASFSDLKKLRPKDADAALGYAKACLLRAKASGDAKDFDAAIEAATSAGETLPMKERYQAYWLAAEIADAKGDTKATLKWVRETRKQKGLTTDLDKQLAEWEEKLVKAAIGK